MVGYPKNFLKRMLLSLFLCVVFLAAIPAMALATDYSTLTWDSFIPANNTKITTTSFNIAVTVTDWDKLNYMKLFIDEVEKPGSVTLSSDWYGDG